MQPKLLQVRVALVPCSFGLAKPAHFLLALAGEEGVFNRHLGAVSRRLDTPDSISQPEPSTRELSLGSHPGRCCSGPHTSLKLTGSVFHQPI